MNIKCTKYLEFFESNFSCQRWKTLSLVSENIKITNILKTLIISKEYLRQLTDFYSHLRYLDQIILIETLHNFISYRKNIRALVIRPYCAEKFVWELKEIDN